MGESPTERQRQCADPRGLSDGARSAWAKSLPDIGAGYPQWYPLHGHLSDAGGVARHLTGWVGPAVMEQVAEPFRTTVTGEADEHEQARRFVQLVAAIHDIGKLTPAFAIKNPSLAGRMHDAGLPIDRRLVLGDARVLRHGEAGQLVVEEWLRERYGWTRAGARAVGAIVGGHHGVPPELGELRRAKGHRALMGAGPWHATRFELLDHMAHGTGTEALLRMWASVSIPQPVQVLVAGLVIVADWIASNTDLFPILPEGNQPADDGRVSAGWARLALPARWSPHPGDLSADALLSARFALPAGSVARPSQCAAVEAARYMDLPGLLVLEDAMGAGKTEAALLAAEALAERCGASGVFFALPTMATANATFSRVLRWLDIVSGEAGGGSVTLAHGKALLNDEYTQLRRIGRAINTVTRGGLHMEGSFLLEDEQDARNELGSAVYAHTWLAGRKKGPLSDFVVGTIDQILLAALRSPHLALRHLGLARKVVVLDEVHATTAYMNVYLRRALEWLGAYGIPTILLSATLPTGLRRSLVGAYEAGMKAATPSREDPLGALDAATSVPVPVSSYPLLTVADSSGCRSRALASAAPSKVVTWEVWEDDGDLRRSLRDVLVEDGCVLVICNTVRRAQETYRGLLPEYGDDVRLMHSRFITHDRLTNDDWLRRSFGPSGDDRPRRSVVVSTQVAEQSLDIDFDLLVTDLAPMDLLLQRVGRIHRHPRPRPPRLVEPRCIVRHVPPVAVTHPETERGASSIYGDHLLLRTAAVLASVEAAGGRSILPADIPALVAAVHDGGGPEPAQWEEALESARRVELAQRQETERAAESYLLGPPGDSPDLVGWLHASTRIADDAHGRAKVRDGEDGIEVLLVDASEEVRVLPWLPEGGGEIIPTDAVPPYRMAHAIAMSAVSLPAKLTFRSKVDATLTELEQLMFPAWQGSHLLAGQLILPLDKDASATVAGVRLRYDPMTGLEEVPVD